MKYQSEEWHKFMEERTAAGKMIDPATAELSWGWAQVIDPYGLLENLPHESDCVGRNITPLIDHQQPITPDQLLAETGGDHGMTNVDHALQPVQHDDDVAAQMPAMEMPTETDHGHHG